MGYVEPHARESNYSPYDMPLAPYPQQAPQQYHHRPGPQQHQFAPHYQAQGQHLRPENHYSHPPPYYPPQHPYPAEESQHSQASYYGPPPSESNLRGIPPPQSISHSISAPNLSHSRESAMSRGPAVYATNYLHQRQPDFSHSAPLDSFSNDASLYKGLLPQPYGGGATEARASLRDMGESNEDAACVLMALKKGCSSPIAQGYYSVARAREIVPVGVGESSLEEDDPSFISFTGKEERRLAEVLEGTSPPSSTTSDSEIRQNSSMASRLPKRAASESPPLSNLRESPKKSRATNNMVKGGVGKYTSLVATPTPGFRGGMESSPALERSVLSQRIIRGGVRIEEEEEEMGEIQKVDFIRSRRNREESHSPTITGPAKKGKGRAMIGTLNGSSPNWLPEDATKLVITSATRSNSSLLGEMLPPHPGSSSSVSSFNLSTPAGPGINQDSLNFKSIYHSSGGGINRNDPYHQLHINPFSRPYPYVGPNSSPPSNGFSFSSPAHPGISKQLGLSATPGPGVSAFGTVEEKDESETRGEGEECVV